MLPPSTMPPAADEIRYGPYLRDEVLVRAPGATFAKGIDAEGRPVLLQTCALGAFEDEASRGAFVQMVAQATALLEAPPSAQVLEHGEASETDELYWALPWPEAGARIGAAPQHVHSAEHLAQIASALLERLQQRHDAGALEPLLSAEALLITEAGRPRLLGLPIHLPPRGLSPMAKPAPFAPEERDALEPTRAGDLWRAGRALIDLAAPLSSAPASLVRLLEQLAAEAPGDRFESAEAALIEIEALQSTVAASREAFEAAHGPPPGVVSEAAADLAQDELLGQATLAMESEPAMSPSAADTFSDAPADDALDEDSLDADTSPHFPSPISGERAAPDKELATVRLPFPSDLKKQAEAELARGLDPVPPGRVTHVAAPSDIPEGETLLEVRRPQHSLPMGAKTVVDEPLASEMTLRDVSPEQLESAGDEFPTMDEVPKKRGETAWDRSKNRKPAFDPTVTRPHGGQKLPPRTAPMGPQGTLVGARLINDPTGLRQQQELPGLLPPPVMGSGAPLTDAAHLSSDLEVPPPRGTNDLPSAARAPQAATPAPVVPAALPPLQHPSQDLPSAARASQDLAPPPVSAPVPAPAANALIAAPTPQPAPSSGASPAPRIPTANASSPPLPPPKKASKLNVLLGALAFFVAGGAAAFALPYLLPGATPSVLTGKPKQAPAKSYAITPANEVLLQASPASAVIVSETDGRQLGRTPMRFLVPPDLDAAIYVAAEGHEPQRVELPVRGRLRTDLVPLSDGTPCTLQFDVPSRVSVEGVAAAVQSTDDGFRVPGAALLRAKVGEGAWLVRCPRLGGLEAQALPARDLPERAELWIVGPSNATVYIDGKEMGTTPLRKTVETGFREISVEKLSAGGSRATRWIPVFGDTKVRMPRPRSD